MKEVTQDWLPAGVLGDHAISEWFDGLIKGWSQRWFIGERCSAGSIAQAGTARLRSGPSDVEEIRSDAGVVSVCIGSRGRGLLLDHALRRASDEIVADGDRPLLDAFAQEIISDLLREIETGLDCKASSARLDTVAWLVMRDTKEQELLSLRLTAEARRALIRRAFGEPREARGLEHRGEALGELSVAIEARAGTATLGLGQLEQLALGDVIILDRTIDSGVEIAVKGGRALALAELSIGVGEAEAKLTTRL